MSCCILLAKSVCQELAWLTAVHLMGLYLEIHYGSHYGLPSVTFADFFFPLHHENLKAPGSVSPWEH